MRLFVLTLSLIAGLVGTSQAQAQSRSVESRVERLERRVIDQERAIDDLYERIDRMDRRGPRQPGGPRQPERLIYSCAVVDSLRNETFGGSGSTQLDAEFSAKEKCQKTVSPTYCNTTAKCDVSGTQGSVGATCIVVDSLRGSTFRGEGVSPIQAEVAAKASCQALVSPTYCNVKARCELKF